MDMKVYFFFPLKKSNEQSKCVCICVLKYEIGSLQQKTAGKQCLDTKESARKMITTASLGVEHETDITPFKV